MTTIINEDKPSGDNTVGMIMGLLLLVVILYLSFTYLIPLLRNAGSAGASPQINVPGKVDVNIKQSK